MVQQTEVRGCDDGGFDGTRIETAVSQGFWKSCIGSSYTTLRVLSTLAPN